MAAPAYNITPIRGRAMAEDYDSRQPTTTAQEGFTQLPNDFFDNLLKTCDSMAEYKIVHTVARLTLGWHKQEDQISYSQFEELTGLKRKAVAAGIKKAIEDGWISRKPSGQNFIYILEVVSKRNQFLNDTSQSSFQKKPEVVSKRNQLQPQVVSLGNTQKKEDLNKGNIKEQQPPAHVETSEEKEYSDKVTRAITAVEKTIGGVNGFTNELVRELIDDYSPDWLLDACREAVKTMKNGDRPNVKYLESILKRWKAEGRGNKSPPKVRGFPLPRVISPGNAAASAIAKIEANAGKMLDY